MQPNYHGPVIKTLNFFEAVCIFGWLLSDGSVVYNSIKNCLKLSSSKTQRHASIFFSSQISTSGSVVKSSSAVNEPDTIVTSRSFSSPSNTSTAMIPADNGTWSST